MSASRRILKSVMAVGFAGALVTLAGFGNQVLHPRINEAMVDAFQKKFMETLGGQGRFEKYIFVWDGGADLKGRAVTKLGLFSAVEEERGFTLKGWLSHGGMSADEPEVPAALRHFYDPTGAAEGRRHLTDRGTYWEGAINNQFSNPAIDAVSWALDVAENPWDWTKGTAKIAQALETEDEAERAALMAAAWRSLGEVLHLVADMGCPPHVRNDSHAAPLGWNGSWALGDPDPFEELVETVDVGALAGGKVDPGLAEAFAKARIPRQVFEAMARFTNEHFFSSQTIVGEGVQAFEPIITDRPPYASPRLENLTYDPIDFSFAWKSAQGDVKLARDQSYFYFRGYPYIDKAVVESQAAALVPNAVAAGVQLIRMAIPELKVEITEALPSGVVKGVVTHTTDDVYRRQIRYTGPVEIWHAGDMTKVVARDGAFESKDVDVVPGKSVYASISFGNVYVKSEDREIAEAAPVLTPYDKSWSVVRSGFDITITARGQGRGVPANVTYNPEFPVVGFHRSVHGNQPYVITGGFQVDVDAREKRYDEAGGYRIWRLKKLEFGPALNPATLNTPTVSYSGDATAFTVVVKPLITGDVVEWKSASLRYELEGEVEVSVYDENGELSGTPSTWTRTFWIGEVDVN